MTQPTAWYGKFRFYKVISAKGRACHGGKFKYLPKYEPKRGHSGGWTPTREAVMCVSGWHVTDARNLHHWTSDVLADRLYLVEVNGLALKRSVYNRKCMWVSVSINPKNMTKYVAKSIRLVRRVRVPKGLLTDLRKNNKTPRTIADAIKLNQKLDRLLGGAK